MYISNTSSYPRKLEFSSAPLSKLPSSFIYISFNADHFRLTHALCLDTWKMKCAYFLLLRRMLSQWSDWTICFSGVGTQFFQTLVPWLLFSAFPVNIKFRWWKFGTKTTFMNAHIKSVMCWITTLLCWDIIIITSNMHLKMFCRRG